MEIATAQDFIRTNGRAVQVTHRKDGSPQMSPILAVVDDDGRVMVSSRESAYKVRNLRRDPRTSLCVMSEGFYGQWIQIDGAAEIVSLPDAMDLLVDYYRRASGEHDDWEDYRAAMERERRLIIRVTIERAGPDRSG